MNIKEKSKLASHLLWMQSVHRLLTVPIQTEIGLYLHHFTALPTKHFLKEPSTEGTLREWGWNWDPHCLDPEWNCAYEYHGIRNQSWDVASPQGSCLSACVTSLLPSACFSQLQIGSGGCCAQKLFLRLWVSVIRKAPSLCSETFSSLSYLLTSSEGAFLPVFPPLSLAGSPPQEALGVLWDNKEAALPCLQSGASYNSSPIAHTRSVKVVNNWVLQRQMLTILISILRLSNSASKIQSLVQ